MTDDNLAAMLNDNNAPFAKMMGVVMTDVRKLRVEGEVKVTKDLCTIPDVMHGGAIMALADNMGGIGAFLNMPDGAMTTTVESKTNFLRAIPMGQTAKAVTTPVNIGRQLQLWKTEIYRDDGKLAAIVTQTQIILAPQT